MSVPGVLVEESSGRVGGVMRLALVAASYLAAVALATWPRVGSLATDLPSLSDPLQHLWVLRWYRTSLLAGRSPMLCPEIQYPVGAPLGNFSPLTLQGLIYLPLAAAGAGDVPAYNSIWLIGFLYTGLGTFALARSVLRDGWAAWFAGLLAMVSTPMLLHAQGHLELLYLGGVPLFLLAWLRFVDRPGFGRLALAVGAYWLVALGTAYYAVFAVVPPVLDILSRAARALRRGDRTWFRERAGWLLAFGALAVAGLAPIFAGQVWAMVQGRTAARSRLEFEFFEGSISSYLLPTSLQRLGRALPWAATGDFLLLERAAYLGIIPMILLVVAAFEGGRGLPRSGTWWGLWLTLVVLSFGAQMEVIGVRVPLPAGWIWDAFYPFRLLRVPTRFNLITTIPAALLAAAGLRAILGRFPGRWTRASIALTLAAASLADLALIPLPTSRIPPLPSCYAAIQGRDPGGAIVEVPQFASSDGAILNATRGYWQSLHGGRTTAGYSGAGNDPFDSLIATASPFAAPRLADPAYLSRPEAETFGLLTGVSFRDYAWLYLTAHGLRHVVLHRGGPPFVDRAVNLGRLERLLGDAKVADDGTIAVFDRDRLPPPARPTPLLAEGWRQRYGWNGRLNAVVGRRGRLIVANPEPDRDLILTLDARALLTARTVRLLVRGVERARWRVEPGAFRSYRSPPFRLPAGPSDLIVESDAEERPSRRQEGAFDGDRRPYSLRVARVTLSVDPGFPPRAILKPAIRGHIDTSN